MSAPEFPWTRAAPIDGGGWRKHRRDCSPAQPHPRRSAPAGSLTQDQFGPFAARAEGEGEMTFQPGDTVRLSKLGESRMKRAPAKTGKVVEAGNRNFSPNIVRVQFDGMKRPVSLHRTYIEKLPEMKAMGK